MTWQHTVCEQCGAYSVQLLRDVQGRLVCDACSRRRREYATLLQERKELVSHKKELLEMLNQVEDRIDEINEATHRIIRESSPLIDPTEQ